jgi:hypothetical protein
MIIGIAMKIEFINKAPNIVNKMLPKSIYLYSFSFQPNVLNLSAINLTDELSNKDITKIRTNTVYRKYAPLKNPFAYIIGIAEKNKAFAGVGNPMNSSVWLVEILNFPNRTADKMAIKKAEYGKYSPNPSNVLISNKNRYIIKLGATPKVTISASESNCFPSSPLTLSNRAAKPSKKSRNKPPKTKNNALG